MVKVILDKRECHCCAFNYCIDANCDRWSEVVRKNGHAESRPVERTTEDGRRRQATPEHKY